MRKCLALGAAWKPCPSGTKCGNTGQEIVIVPFFFIFMILEMMTSRETETECQIKIWPQLALWFKKKTHLRIYDGFGDRLDSILYPCQWKQKNRGSFF